MKKVNGTISEKLFFNNVTYGYIEGGSNIFFLVALFTSKQKCIAILH